MPFDDDRWLPQVVDSINDDERFHEASREFDGSITLEMGDTSAWLKVYRGRVIDTEPYVPVFGTTFTISDDREAWRALAHREASLSEQFYDGSLRTQGNKLEVNRLREATELLVRHLQQVVSGTMRPSGVER